MASDQQRRTSSSRDDGARRSGTRRTSRDGSTRRPSGTARSASGSAARTRSALSARRSSSTRRSASDSSAQRRSSAARTQASRSSAARKSAARKQAAARRPRRNRPAFSLNSILNLPRPVLIGAGVAVLLVLALFHHLLRFGITINGERATIWRGTSIEKLLDKGKAEPTPGNLVAVDGSLLEEGAGKRCDAFIDGTEVTDLKTKIHRGADVQISDGSDIMEDYTQANETIPRGTANDSREFDAYWFGSIHLLSDGQDGVLSKRTGKVSGITVSEVKEPAIDAGYSIYTAKPDEKIVALTFDDGPWPDTTDQILDILQENGAKATFFTIGNQISSYPDQVRRANEIGCQVCTHTWDHADGSGGGTNITLMSSQEQIDEVQKGYAAIAEVLGQEPAHIMRAPGGNFYGSTIDNLWQYVDAEIGWDVDTEDWSLPGVEHIASMILSVQPGQVVLMHDGGGDRTQTVEALRQALPQLKEQGYQFVTVSELIALGKPDTSSSDVVNVG